MEGHDHSDCPVEFRACPEEHPADEGLPEAVVEIMFPVDWRHEAQPHCRCGCSEINLGKVVGWCLHCDHVYAEYKPAIQSQHLAYHCPGVPSELKRS